MNKFKDADLSHLPPHIVSMLRDLIPENADVEIICADVKKSNADDVKDNCTPMGCQDCRDCPIDKEAEAADGWDRVAEHSEICRYLNALYAAKNADYGNSFGDTYADLGIVSAITRIVDKTNRLKSLGKPTTVASVKDESIRDTLLDLANYAIMTVIEMNVQEGRY